MKWHRRLVLVGLACVLGFTLVGCAGQSDRGDVAGGSPSVDTKTSTSPDAEPNIEEVAAEDCLTGSWLANNEFFFEGMRQYGEETQSVTGNVVVTYGEDGALTTDYQGWLITFVSEGETTLISRDGIDVGTFTATAENVTIKDTQMGSMLLVTVGGMEMPVDPNPIFYEDVPYTCSATEASLTTPDGEMRMTRR